MSKDSKKVSHEAQKQFEKEVWKHFYYQKVIETDEVLRATLEKEWNKMYNDLLKQKDEKFNS